MLDSNLVPRTRGAARHGIGNKRGQDFPGGGMVRTLPFNAGGAGLIPDWRSKIPHASQQKTKNKKNPNKKQKQYCNKFNKDFRK